MPGENLPRRVWNRQTKLTYNHWLAALVKGKCSSTKPTCLASGVMCNPDTEQNRPYKIRPWRCRGLNREPTAPQARTLPVCHTSPFYIKYKIQIQNSKTDFTCKVTLPPLFFLFFIYLFIYLFIYFLTCCITNSFSFILCQIKT